MTPPSSTWPDPTRASTRRRRGACRSGGRRRMPPTWRCRRYAHICEILDPVGPEVRPIAEASIVVRGASWGSDPDTAVADRRVTFAATGGARRGRDVHRGG
ncbi:MAG: hypothetical protein R3F43_01885 [bacterium]